MASARARRGQERRPRSCRRSRRSPTSWLPRTRTPTPREASVGHLLGAPVAHAQALASARRRSGPRRSGRRAGASEPREGGLSEASASGESLDRASVGARYRFAQPSVAGFRDSSRRPWPPRATPAAGAPPRPPLGGARSTKPGRAELLLERGEVLVDLLQLALDARELLVLRSTRPLSATSTSMGPVRARHHAHRRPRLARAARRLEHRVALRSSRAARIASACPRRNASDLGRRPSARAAAPRPSCRCSCSLRIGARRRDDLLERRPSSARSSGSRDARLVVRASGRARTRRSPCATPAAARAARAPR